jgi:hypothetical protein
MQNAHVATLADGGAGGPVAAGGENREAAQARRRRFGGGLTKRREGALTTGEGAHLQRLSDGEQNDGEMFSNRVKIWLLHDLIKRGRGTIYAHFRGIWSRNAKTRGLTCVLVSIG